VSVLGKSRNARGERESRKGKTEKRHGTLKSIVLPTTETTSLKGSKSSSPRSRIRNKLNTGGRPKSHIENRPYRSSAVAPVKVRQLAKRNTSRNESEREG